MVNEGVKIVCDKVLENPDITDGNSQAAWDTRRWIKLADFIIDNDYDTFSEEEVEMVKNTIREARRKYFTANVLDQVVWETDPTASKDVYSHPPLPRSQKELKREREEYERNKVEEVKRKQMEYEYRLKNEAMRQSQYKSSGYGMANSLLGGQL